MPGIFLCHRSPLSIWRNVNAYDASSLRHKTYGNKLYIYICVVYLAICIFQSDLVFIIRSGLGQMKPKCDKEVKNSNLPIGSDCVVVI